MRLLLVHHGDALPSEVDPQRPLSSVGRAAVDLLAARVAARGVKPTAIWHSGKLRARQTAEAFWRACNPLAELKAVRGLQPDDRPRTMIQALSDVRGDLLIVGHMPNLPRLLGALTTGDLDAAPPFPLHGIVALERVEDGRWEERWREEGGWEIGSRK